MSDLDPNPIFDATVLDRGLVPDPPRRDLGAVRVVYTGHGLTHGTYRPDIRGLA